MAYSSVSHMGFIVLGIFALNSTALDGSSIQMLNHGLTTGALFACVGMIYERYHTRDMNKIGGPLEPAADPGVLPDPGGPRLGGGSGTERVRRRVSDPGRHVRDQRARGRAGGDRDDSGCMLPALDGAQDPVRTAARAGASCGATARQSLLRASSHTAIPPVGVHEIAGLAPLMFLIVAIGVYPRPVLEQMRPTLASIDQTTHGQSIGGEIKTS